MSTSILNQPRLWLRSHNRDQHWPICLQYRDCARRLLKKAFISSAHWSDAKPDSTCTGAVYRGINPQDFAAGDVINTA